MEPIRLTDSQPVFVLKNRKELVILGSILFDKGMGNHVGLVVRYQYLGEHDEVVFEDVAPVGVPDSYAAVNDGWQIGNALEDSEKYSRIRFVAEHLFAKSFAFNLYLRFG